MTHAVAARQPTSRTAPAAAARARAKPPEAAPAPSDDVLVFEHDGERFGLVGGRGRGAGWAGIVELTQSDEALVGRSWRRGTAERVSSSRPVQIAGPYYARYAAAVPVGQRHVVVFGSRRPIRLRDTELVRFAAAVVDGTHAASADKLLADELELVHALRTLMAYRPLTVRETARHVAMVAAEALSCEVAVIHVEHDGQDLVEGVDVRSMTPLANPDATPLLGRMRDGDGPLVEQVATREPDIFGVEVAARMTLPLAGGVAGTLALGHVASRARGFTSLCQRIGRAIAEASELLIGQAQTREQLATERDLLARLVRTDALTALANRRAWDDEVERWRADPSLGEAVVVSCDLDALKAANDAYGHDAVDALIRGAANLLRSCVRESDLVARIGGDEFIVLLHPADAATARRVIGRVRRVQRAWRVTDHALTPQLSIGAAAVVDADLERARTTADRAMYANKRRRAKQRLKAGPVTSSDRRRRVALGSDRRTGATAA